MIKRNYTKSEYAETWLNSENGIVYQVISPKVKKINLEIAQQLVKDRKQAMGNPGYKVPVFVVVNNAMSVDSAAKQYYDQPFAFEDIQAIAMYMDNYVSKMVGRIVFSIKRPKVPTSFFNSEDKAIEWLQSLNRHQLN
jgi:hypothetical protein